MAMARHLRGAQRLREGNRADVLVRLREHGPASRATLARELGMSPTTAASLVDELLTAGLVMETPATPQGGRGRPARLVAATTPPGLVAGIDIGRRHLRIALADHASQVLAEHVVDIEPDRDRERTTEDALELVAQLLEGVDDPSGELDAVGVGLPGPLQSDTGTVTTGTILPEWVGYDIVAVLHERLAVPVAIDNDANLGMLGESRHGRARGANDAVYIKVSSGIGCGMLLDGDLYRGAAGTAGELGHTVIDPAGPVCRCGSRGCLETVASVPALLEALGPALGHGADLEEVFDRAAAGERACLRALNDMGQAVGRGIAVVCNVLNPQAVIVGGPLAAAGEVFFDAVQSTVGATAVPQATAGLVIEAAELGSRAELVGALELAASNVASGADHLTTVRP